MSALLEGRVIIVTGAARGIGQAYAKGLAEQGATVVAADILPCGETLGMLGGDHLGLTLDVTNMTSCTAMAEATIKAYGRIDGIINNAAMFGPSAVTEGAQLLPFDQISEDAWTRMLAVNVTGVWHACKAVVPAMRAQGYGKVVNISSNTIQLGNPNLLHYVVSKGAIATMTRCLARELGPDGIRVNTLVPGFIQSQASKDIMRDNHAEGITDAMTAICSLGREQYADDLVGTAVYLMSALSDFVSGQMISVDGGACFTGM
jgi:NAD(P)-dependent dehydrogenase (short-subunit alcohol dehydrogenase family)